MKRLSGVLPRRRRSLSAELPITCCAGSTVPIGIDNVSNTHGSARQTLASGKATVAVLAFTDASALIAMAAGPAPDTRIVWLTSGRLSAELLAHASTPQVESTSRRAARIDPPVGVCRDDTATRPSRPDGQSASLRV